MTSFRARLLLIGLGAIVLAAVAVAASQSPAFGAGALLHPLRRHVDAAPPAGCREATFSGLGVNLAGWRCAGSGHRRGTVIYLHGAADNRESSLATIQRFLPLGFDVVAYDSRAHGDSGGDVCTYGFFEKHDLRRVIDSVQAGPVVLIGGSLGAAVALQAAADDPRVHAVVAVETFSDLRTVATERAPFFFTSGIIARVSARRTAGTFQRGCRQPGRGCCEDRCPRAPDPRGGRRRNAGRSLTPRVRSAARAEAARARPRRVTQRIAAPRDLGPDRALGSRRARTHGEPRLRGLPWPDHTNAAHPDMVFILGDLVIQGVLGGNFVSPEDIAAELELPCAFECRRQ